MRWTASAAAAYAVYDVGAAGVLAGLGGIADAVDVSLAQRWVISAAAAIMIVVFLSVMLGANVAVKQIGLGLAVAVAIDATLVRFVLVPAVMELPGPASWWLPRPLARILPGVRFEDHAATAEPDRAPASIT